MTILRSLIVGAAIGSVLVAMPASAQEGSIQVGTATVTVGGGTAILTLPDVPSFITVDSRTAPFRFINGFTFNNDFGDEIGWNVNGSIEAPIGIGRTISLNGFWAKFDDKESATCTETAATFCSFYPLVDNPAIAEAVSVANAAGGFVTTNAERDVDQWGISLELQRQLKPGGMGVTQTPSRRHFAFGVDIRGIDQKLDVTVTPVNAGANVGLATYKEDLDTRYYGAYAAWGGDFPRLLLGNFWERWGLHSTFTLRGGVYYADIDYGGRLNDTSFQGPFNRNVSSTLSLSDDNVAFIGGLVLETKKRIGRRAILSLKSEYEYYSYVPEMAYNTVDVAAVGGSTPLTPGRQNGTVINDNDAFSARSMLRLTIGLGPGELHQ